MDTADNPGSDEQRVRLTRRARQLWQLLEPVHGVVYFAPDAQARFEEIGLKGFWMGYFALPVPRRSDRSAPTSSWPPSTSSTPAWWRARPARRLEPGLARGRARRPQRAGRRHPPRGAGRPGHRARRRAAAAELAASIARTAAGPDIRWRPPTVPPPPPDDPLRTAVVGGHRAARAPRRRPRHGPAERRRRPLRGAGARGQERRLRARRARACSGPAASGPTRTGRPPRSVWSTGAG